jgi:uroporphyrinogen III methyltransferase/synthase
VTVALVGAGPGDPGLLTRRGAELLAAADVVIYDRLGTDALLDLAPATARRISVGKAPGSADANQDQINALLVEHGRAGHAVVRLKGGDPFVFGRGGEEAEALAAADIPFEIVPGVTSAIAAPAYAGIPVTHRGLSTHVTIVTGHEDPTKGHTDVDWARLAAAGGTLVILMGAATLPAIAAQLLAAGLPAATPVAAVHAGTRPEQRTTRATLGTVVDLPVAAPAAVVVGAVAALDLAWFEQRPLFGRTIVVTRAREQASELRGRLTRLGGRVVELPTIRIDPLPVALPPLVDVDWLVLTSANGVSALFERGIIPAGRDARALAGVRIAAIGPGTAAALARYGVRADLVPARYVAEALLEAFPPPTGAGGRVLLARAEQARDVLPDGLRKLGYDVDVLPLYRTRAAEPDPAILDQVRRGHVDAITFTSSSTVRNFVELVGTLDPQPPVVSIGPITSATARELGLRVDAEAAAHTIDGLVTALLDTLA